MPCTLPPGPPMARLFAAARALVAVLPSFQAAWTRPQPPILGEPLRPSSRPPRERYGLSHPNRGLRLHSVRRDTPFSPHRTLPSGIVCRTPTSPHRSLPLRHWPLATQHTDLFLRYCPSCSPAGLSFSTRATRLWLSASPIRTLRIRTLPIPALLIAALRILAFLLITTLLSLTLLILTLLTFTLRTLTLLILTLPLF